MRAKKVHYNAAAIVVAFCEFIHKQTRSQRERMASNPRATFLLTSMASHPQRIFLSFAHGKSLECS
jgi:hypothetical protein